MYLGGVGETVLKGGRGQVRDAGILILIAVSAGSKLPHGVVKADVVIVNAAREADHFYHVTAALVLLPLLQPGRVTD